MTAIVMLENIDDLENEYITYSKTALNMILGTGSAVYAGDGLKVGEKRNSWNWKNSLKRTRNDQGLS